MSKSILIVDDRKANIDMLTTILKQDYAIMAAVSGENACKLMDRRKPDLVLLDVFMPGMDGFGVLAYMKSSRDLSGMPVVFVTGEHDEVVEERGLFMGAVDYIKKPYNAAVVQFKVRNHLLLKQYRDELETLVVKRTAQLTASREAIIMGMSLMSESHDPVTSGHIERIKTYTRILAEQLLAEQPGLLSREAAEQIILYSPLHDMGKIELPDTVLGKETPLTPEEQEIMRRHTLIGGELLRRTEIFFFEKSEEADLGVAVDIAECHHEHYDGTGYPRGLAGEDIPLSARIVALADVYDRLRSNLFTEKQYNCEEAVEAILHGDGTVSPSHFDPRVLEAFKNARERFRYRYTNKR